jgi:hypothetical protein
VHCGLGVLFHLLLLRLFRSFQVLAGSARRFRF